MPEQLPALASPEDLAPLVGLTADSIDEDRARAALEAASDEVRDAAGGRTFVVGGEPDVPGAVRRVVLAAARRAYWLYGTDGLSEESLDDWRGKTDASVLSGAELTVAETKRCARYSGLPQVFSVPIDGGGARG